MITLTDKALEVVRSYMDEGDGEFTALRIGISGGSPLSPEFELTLVGPDDIGEGEREVEEGCLSIPGFHAFITRSIWVKAKGLDRQSRLVRLRANGLLAQVLEHEIDHLNGILYTDHLQSHQELLKNEAVTEDASTEAVAI